MKRQNSVSLLLLAGISMLLVSSVSGSWLAGPFSPSRLANASDVVVHGTITTVESSGGLPTDRYEVNHPVTIRVTDVFKGEAGDSITLQVGGDNDTHISTAASFEEGENVVVMLQEQDAVAHPHIDMLYYLTAGAPGKFTVENGIIQLQEPEQKRVTVEQMKEIVQQPDTINITALPAQNVSDAASDNESAAGHNNDSDGQHAGGLFHRLWKRLATMFA